ncbi:hypothetical protein [Sorangium sp. So ce381]|uniref:hypothetical protein n=1 Tax=Sorangium sp. So ce381 TaxID=3133307 RepID=UPI003F5C8D86
MRTNPHIDGLLDTLLSIHATLGVQPSDLADAAFEDPYQSIEVVKNDDLVCTTVTFLDMDDPSATRHKMRYVYASDRRLLRIEQKVGSKSFKVQWDRNEAVDRVLVELVQQLRALNSSSNVERFISTVPEELRERFLSKVRAVA